MSRWKFVSICLLARLAVISAGCTFDDGADDTGDFKAEPGIEVCSAAEGIC